MHVCTKDYKNAVLIGPGGLGCACCMPLDTIKKSRIAINRAFRRKKKSDIKKEVEEISDVENT